MEKAVAKAVKPVHRAIAAAAGYLEAEAVGLAVLGAAANLADRGAAWAEVAGRCGAAAAPADAVDAGAGVLAHFEDAVPRLVARHAAEVRRQLAQLPAVLDTLRAAQEAASVAAAEVSDAARAAAAPPPTTVYVSTALAGGGVGGAGRSSGSGGSGGGIGDSTLDMPLGPAALASIARQLFGALAADALGKALLVSDLMAAGAGDAGPAAGADGDAEPSSMAGARFLEAARCWATATTALMPHSALAASLPPPVPPCPPALRAAWVAASDGAWRFSGATLEEHLLAKTTPPTPPASTPPPPRSSPS